MKKSILFGLIFAGLFFIASTSYAYQPNHSVLPSRDLYRDLSGLMNPLNPLPGFSPGFSGTKNLNAAILDRMLREILYLFTLLRQIEAAIGDKIGEIGAPANNSFGRVVDGKPRKGGRVVDGAPRKGKDKEGNQNLPAARTPEGTLPVSGVSGPSSSAGSSDSSGKIKIAIIDICPEHAALVEAVIRAESRRQNPDADIEIEPFILPGEWKADGSKEVTEKNILAALGKAKRWGARVVNMSIGSRNGLGRFLLNTLSDLRQSGILVVAASGNEGGRDSWAGADVLSVGALDEYFQRRPYSNSADIYRVVSGRLQGTSFAAPIVAVEAALALLGNPSLSVADLYAMLGSQGNMYAAGTPSRSSANNLSTSSFEIVIPPFFYGPVEEPAFAGLGFFSPQFNRLTEIPGF